MKKSIIYINQPWWAKILGKIKFKSLNISEIELSEDTWYESEGNFVWSYPNAKIKLSNTDTLILTFKCPLGREVIFKSKYFAVKRQLIKDKIYTFSIDTSNLEELEIKTIPYSPKSDTRSLGLCFYNISDKV
jgi:hypothetical protein